MLKYSRALFERANAFRVQRARKISGFPDRKDVVSLLCGQHFDPAVKASIGVKTLLLDACVQTLPSVQISRASDIVSQWVCQPMFAFRLSDAYVSLGNGNVFFPFAGKYVFETSWGWAKYRTASIGTFKRDNVIEITSGRPLYLFSGRGYHGVMEDLSSILLLHERGEKFDIVIAADNDWMRQLLDNLLPEEFNIRTVTGRPWVKAREFIVTTKSAFGEFVHPGLIKHLNNAVRNVQGESDKGKLFISRSDSNNRTYREEEGLTQLFLDQGYTRVVLSEMSVREQIVAFKHADAVAGLHGAGFVNLVWCQTPVKVTELYFHSHFNSCYSSLSYILGHNYNNFLLTDTVDFGTQKNALRSAIYQSPT